MRFCYCRTTRLKQELRSCNNRTNYIRRHIYYSQKQTAARSSEEAVMTSHCS